MTPSSILSEFIRKQLSEKELADLLDGIELFSALHPNADGELGDFIEISLLALGFENGKRMS